MQTQWTGTDPETGERRIYQANFFAKKWTFQVKAGRRAEWEPVARPTRALWMEVVDFLKRAYTRRQCTIEQVREVEAIAKRLPENDNDDGL